MSTPGNEQTPEALTGKVQEAANGLTDAAQQVANSGVDLASGAAKTLIEAVLDANDAISQLLRGWADKLVD